MRASDFSGLSLGAFTWPCRRRARSRAAAAPISIGFLLTSCTVIFSSLPVRMAASILSVSVMVTKQPTLVQVWIGCRSAAPLSTLTVTGSVRLSPSGSVSSIAPVLASGAGRTTADSTSCRVSRWNTCWTARHSSALPSPEHSTRHAAADASGACAGAGWEAAAIKTASPVVAVVSMTRLPAGETQRLARMAGGSSDGGGSATGKRDRTSG